MEQGDFQGALDLYQAVLNNNPSSTSALTGMQLAKAKLRLVGQQVVPQTPDVVTMPVVDNVSSVLAQMVANPRDASLAVKVADLYKAQGKTAKAVEYYRKALQLDVVYKSGLDRMAVYDALSTLQ
jgi:tetratricopeptide (TPR) repeat protein